MANRVEIRVTGMVQGVGFRPFVYNLARSLDCNGYVANTPEGLIVEIEGENCAPFIHRLKQDAPPMSKIDQVTCRGLPIAGYTDFKIVESRHSEDLCPVTLISPDVATCDQCLNELWDPDNRRYLYPFINCTNCGPRYSITCCVPYDRPNTTMAAFKMCDLCQCEYGAPEDRRFHAQPNACPKCGPSLEFIATDSGFLFEGCNDPMAAAVLTLKQGGIIALRGLGGFQIACDATNEAAVSRLRDHKRKSNKPFAIMAPHTQSLGFCEISSQERTLLLSPQRPIVLLNHSLTNRTRSHSRERAWSRISCNVSPGNKRIGVMLAYTPLHHLLFYYPLSGTGRARTQHFQALVMTSGNIADEPIVKDNDEAIRQLSPLVDGILLHNREIAMRVDDTVMVSHTGKLISFIRRARGYVPEPIKFSDDGPQVVGCGADLKNTFTITKGRYAIVGQHIGDMANHETNLFFEESLERLKAMHHIKPQAVAHDLHPGYFSSLWAKRLATEHSGMRRFAIQHHYAHVASVMAEHGLTGPIIGVALDGTGYGTDGCLWGGEFIVADLQGFNRVGHFDYVPVPGGKKAIQEPWRMALSYIQMAAGPNCPRFFKELGFANRYEQSLIDNIIRLITAREVSPLCSSAGRLFDAASAIIGLCEINTFEGEAAMALEACVEPTVRAGYPAAQTIRNGVLVLNFYETIMAIIKDVLAGVSPGIISTKFHNSIVAATLKAVNVIAEKHKVREVALGGGIFQNTYLLTQTVSKLEHSGNKVYLNQKVPCNDGGISLGQAYIARARLCESQAEENNIP